MTIYRTDSEGSLGSGNSDSGLYSGDRSLIRQEGWSPVSWRTLDDMNLEIPLKKQSVGTTESGGTNGGVTLAWQDLTVYVPATKKTGMFQRKETHNKPFKRVINNVTGIVTPGSLMAIMGASGAGKTTLMNVLANKGKAVIDGEIRVNGMPLGKFVRHMSGFVHQHDLFLGSLTVSEHLHFMARMKLDRRLSSWERQRRVEELMVELNLSKCADTRIGIPGLIQGLSGGERKRLSFASEVITDPPLLFCDEPTTGLDSYSAQKLVAMMQGLAAKGKTILCTIHQPSSQVFVMFNQLLLLAEGRTAYMGTAGGALTFMKQLGYVCPDDYNPADFYIKTLAVYPGREEESRKQIRSICDTFSVSSRAKEIEDRVSQEVMDVDFLHSSYSSTESLSDQTILGFHTRRPNWFVQTYWLFWRNFLHSMRNPRIHSIRTVQKIVLATLIGLCYFGVELNQMGIQNIQGVLFVFVSENTFRNMYGIINVFPAELPLFMRENHGGLYRCDSYYIAKVTSMLPGFLLEPLLFCSIAYWMVGLRPTAEAFFYTAVVILLTANVAAAAGCFFSALFENTSVAITLLIPFDYFLMITAGVFINIKSLPSFFSWAKFLSWFSYSYEALTITQWENITNVVCDGLPGEPCIPDGAGVIASRSLSESHFTWDFVGLGALYCGFHLLGYLSLLRRTKQT